MFEHHQFRRQTGAPPLARPDGDAPPPPGEEIARLSFMVWGEHCVECAAPACFTSCDLYLPRPDHRCRRFAEGIAPNPHFQGPHGAGSEIAFRKWAKLEARGNTAMAPLTQIQKAERRLARLAPWANRLGALLHRLTGQPRFRHLAFSLLEKWNRHLHRTNPNPDIKPDGFLLTLFNPASTPLPLHLRMGVSRASLEPAARDQPLPPPFSAALEVPPGHSRHFFEHRFFQSISGAGLPFDVTLIPDGDREARLVVLIADFVILEAARPAAGAPGATPAKPVKCLVWDLDHTLWDGVLLEGEPKGLRPGARELIEHLDRRGVLHAIASRNSHDHAWRQVEKFGLMEYFLAPQINWGAKSASVRRIAEALNIGVDALAFIDDNPFERDEVSQALPMVTVRDAADLQTLFDDPLFQGSDTPEAAQRRQYYRDAIQREQAQSGFGADYRAFLAACAIEATIVPYEPKHLDRVSELAQRTNQLNFSGRKYTRENLTPLLADPDLAKHVIAVRDRFGSYGIVGFSLTARSAGLLHIREFMLSCRVQGKFIEQAFFNHLIQQADPIPDRLVADFHATDRNQPARQTLEAMGFEAEGAGYGRKIAGRGDLDLEFIQVVDHEGNNSR